MNNGIYMLIVRGKHQFIKYEEGRPFFLEPGKKGAEWTPTILCPDRVKTLKPVHVDNALLAYELTLNKKLA